MTTLKGADALADLTHFGWLPHHQVLTALVHDTSERLLNNAYPQDVDADNLHRAVFGNAVRFARKGWLANFDDFRAHDLHRVRQLVALKTRCLAWVTKYNRVAK